MCVMRPTTWLVPRWMAGTQRIPQGTVRYPDGRTKTWPRDAIEPIDS